MNHFKSIFEGAKCKNRIYCIEASAVTKEMLPLVKTHIFKILQDQFQHGNKTKFNLICFNSDVAKWCVNIAPCTDEYVTIAEEWLNHIQSIGTCNFLGAIVSALREPLMSTFCFVVAQAPDQEISEILDLFAYIGRKTQIHIRLLLLGPDITLDLKKAFEIYSQIAEETNGTFAFVKQDENQELVIMESTKNILNKQELKLIVANWNSIDEEDENIKKWQNMREEEKKQLFNVRRPSIYQDDTKDTFTPNLEGSNYRNYKPFDLWKRVSVSQPYLDCMNVFKQTIIEKMETDNISPLGASVIVGREVLAKKYSSGLYHVGYVKSKLNGDLFNVVFGPHDWSYGQYQETEYQSTKLVDLIDLNDALKRSVMPGDRILAPDPHSSEKDRHVCRYLTGTVLHGCMIREFQEKSSISSQFVAGKSHFKTMTLQSTETLIVEFTHPLNKTEKVFSKNVMFISESFFQRLCLEGAMPKSAREKLYKITNYPIKSLPGYPTSGSKKPPFSFNFTNLNILKSRTLQVDYLMPPYCLPIYPIIEIFEKDPRTGIFHAGQDSSNEPAPLRRVSIGSEDKVIPDTNYTIGQLQKKIEKQLDFYKDFTKSLANSDKAHYFKILNKKPESDQRLINTKISKTNERLQTRQRLFQKVESPLKTDMSDDQDYEYFSTRLSPFYSTEFRNGYDSVQEMERAERLDSISSCFSEKVSYRLSFVNGLSDTGKIEQIMELLQTSAMEPPKEKHNSIIRMADAEESNKSLKSLEIRKPNQKDNKKLFCELEIDIDEDVATYNMWQKQLETMEKTKSLGNKKQKGAINEVKSARPLLPNFDDDNNNNFKNDDSGMKNKIKKTKKLHRSENFKRLKEYEE